MAESPHLLLLPGLLNDERLWQHQVEHLGGAAVPVVGDLTKSDSMALLAADALARVPAERFVLAGLSMGGYVALEIMRQAPERVRALALVDTMARPDTPEATANRERLMDLARKDFSRVVDALLPRFVHPERLEDERITGLVRDMADTVGSEAFLLQQRAIIDRVDSRPYLGAIGCPTLVLCGREDAVASVDIHQEMASAIPGASMMVIENCGHLSPLERPEAVTEALREWLRNTVVQ